MARILFLPYTEQIGSTYPLLDLASHFAEKGDEIIFAGSGKYKKLIEDSGYRIEPLIEVPYPVYNKSLKTGGGNFHTYETAKEHIAAELELFKRIKPDLVIAQNRPTARVSGDICKIKTISLIVAMATRYRDVKVYEADLFIFSKLFKFPLFGKLFSKGQNKIIELYSKLWLKPYNKIAKEYGIKPYQSFFDLIEGNLLTLIPESESLFPLQKGYPKDKYFFIGPQLTKAHFDTPDWYNEAKEKDGNFIYLSMGSTSQGLYPYVFHRLVKIFGGSKEVNIVTNTSWILDGDKEMRETPDNVFVANITPAEAMFNLADLTICHGGNGTIYHSLLFGVPIYCVVGRVEHELNMKRLEELNLGSGMLYSQFRKMSDKEIYDTIMKIMNDAKMKEAAKNFGQNLTKEMVRVDQLVDYIRKSIC